jgi:WD40 repeat protein
MTPPVDSTLPAELLGAHARGELVLCVGPTLDGRADMPALAAALLAELDDHEHELDIDAGVLRGWIAEGRGSEGLELLEHQLGPRFVRMIERQLVSHGPSSALAEAIAALRGQLRAVYSTTLDHGLERAFHDEWPSFATPRPDIARRRRVIFKLCGTVDFPESWVLTRAALERELGERSLRRQVFAAAYRAHCLLFIAFNPNDEVLTRLLAAVDPVDKHGQQPAHFMIVSACEREQRVLLERRGIQVIIADAIAALRSLTGAPQLRPRDTAELPDCPYPGLHAFDRSLAPVFHGRRAEISQAAARLGHRRWLSIEGASGVGKSSFVHAGVVPALGQGFAEGTPVRFVIVDLRPGRRPFQALASALAAAFNSEPPSTVDGLFELVDRRTSMESGVLLVIDQLEEAVTLAEPEPRRRFAEALARLLTAERVYVITTVRADFVTEISIALPELARLLNEQAERYTLAPISRIGLREAITEPAAQLGVAFEPELVERITSDAEDHLTRLAGREEIVRTSDTALPLVAHVLRGLWDAQAHADGRVTLDEYWALGGVSGALSRGADSLLASLDREQLGHAKALLLGLVKLDAAGHDTRRSLDYAEAVARAGGGEVGRRLLSTLSGGAGARLVVVRSQGDQSLVDLVHEALLREWETLRGWIEDDRSQLRCDETLGQRAATWAEQGRPWRSLPRGRERRELLRGRAHGEDASIQREYQRAMQRAVWARVGAWLGFAAMVLVVASAVAQRLEANALERERAEFDKQRAENEQQRAELEKQEAEAERERVSVERALREDLDRHRGKAALERLLDRAPGDHEGLLRTAVMLPAIVGELARHTGRSEAITSLRHHPSGRFVVIARADGSVERWDLETLEVHELVAAGNSQGHLRFSPDGALLAYERDGAFKLLDTSTGEALAAHLRGGVRAEFSPDSERLAVWTNKGRNVTVHDLASGHLGSILSDGNTVRSVAFIPGTDLLASSSTGNELTLWSLSSNEVHATLDAGGRGRSIGASFDGRFVAGAADHNPTRAWSLAPLREAATIEVDTSVNPSARYVQFRPASHDFVTAVNTGRISMTNADTGRPRFEEVPCKDELLSFSADGRWLLTANPEGHATLREGERGQAVADVEIEGEIAALDLVPGERFVVATSTGQVSLWGLETSVGWRSPDVHPRVVRALEFFPEDPTRLVSASSAGDLQEWALGEAERTSTWRGGDWITAVHISSGGVITSLARDGSLRRWNAQEQRELEALASACKAGGSPRTAGHGEYAAILCKDEPVIEIVDLRSGERSQRRSSITVEALAVSADGRSLAVGANHAIELLDTQNEARLLAAPGHDVRALGFASHADILVSGGNDGSVRVWSFGNLEDPELRVDAQMGRITAVAISADGRRLAVANEQGQINLYTHEGRQIALSSSWTHHDRRVEVLRFSANSSLLASGSADGSVRVWPIDIAAQVRLACDRLQPFTTDSGPAACARP